MGKLFISHSSKDKVIADALVVRARSLGYDCFLDFQGIPGGAQWEKEIYDAMRQSVAVLVCATPAAMESRWVFAEMLLARYSGIPVIPLIMQECALPELISATTQHIDFKTDPEAGYSKLWAALDQLKVTPAGPKWPLDRSPYPGLLALQEDHAPV